MALNNRETSLLKRLTGIGTIMGMLALAGLTSCGEDVTKPAKDQYRVSGKVTSPSKDGKIKLYRIDSTNLIAFDSAVTDESGTFQLKGKLPVAGPAFFVLDVYGIQRVLVPIDSGSALTIEVTGNDDDVVASKLSGSLLADEFNAVEEIRSWFDKQQEAVNQTYFNAKSRQGDQAFADSLTTVARNVEIELGTRVKNQIRKMGTSLISLHAAQMLNPERDYAFMDSLGRAFKIAKKGDMQGVGAFVELLDKLASIRDGAVAPALELPTPEGQNFSLTSLKGQVVLVDFWASWCGPCRRANPEVVKLYKAFSSKGFTVLGVSLDDDKAKWTEAIKKDGLTWHHISDLKRWESATNQVWQVTSIPTSFLIDKDGKIAARNLSGEALTAKVAELVAQ